MKKIITLSVATFAVFALAVAFALPNRASAQTASPITVTSQAKPETWAKFSTTTTIGWTTTLPVSSRIGYRIFLSPTSNSQSSLTASDVVLTGDLDTRNVKTKVTNGVAVVSRTIAPELFAKTALGQYYTKVVAVSCPKGSVFYSNSAITVANLSKNIFCKHLAPNYVSGSLTVAGYLVSYYVPTIYINTSSAPVTIAAVPIPAISITNPIIGDQWLPNSKHDFKWALNFKKGTNNTGIEAYHGAQIVPWYGYNVDTKDHKNNVTISTTALTTILATGGVPASLAIAPMVISALPAILTMADSIFPGGGAIAAVLDPFDWFGSDNKPQGISTTVNIVQVNPTTGASIGAPIKIGSVFAERQNYTQRLPKNLPLGNYKIELIAKYKTSVIADTTSGMFSIASTTAYADPEPANDLIPDDPISDQIPPSIINLNVNNGGVAGDSIDSASPGDSIFVDVGETTYDITAPYNITLKAAGITHTVLASLSSDRKDLIFTTPDLDAGDYTLGVTYGPANTNFSINSYLSTFTIISSTTASGVTSITPAVTTIPNGSTINFALASPDNTIQSQIIPSCSDSVTLTDRGSAGNICSAGYINLPDGANSYLVTFANSSTQPKQVVLHYRAIYGSAVGQYTEAIATTTINPVAVATPPSVSLTAASSSITSGASTLLNWSSDGLCTQLAASSKLSNNISVPLFTQNGVSSGSVSTGVLNTVDTYTYTLTCSNSAGLSASATATVVVDAPITTYTISTSVSPALTGTVTGGGSNIAAGTLLILPATPATGYVLSSWTDATTGAVVSTDNSYMFTVTGNRTLVANFSPISTNATHYSVNLHVASSTITAGDVARLSWSITNIASCMNSIQVLSASGNPSNIPLNSDALINTHANSGALVAGTYIFTMNCTGTDGVTQASSTVTVVVNAAGNGVTTYTISASVFPTNTGYYVGGVGAYSSGSTVTLTAFPPASPTTPLTFVNWTENGVVATTSNPYVFPADQNRNLVANFSPISTNATHYSVNLHVASSTITAGDVARLSWSITNIASCMNSIQVLSASGNPSNIPLNSDALINTHANSGALVAGTYIFTMNCTGTDGVTQASSTVTVVVNAAGNGVTTYTISASVFPTNTGYYVGGVGAYSSGSTVTLTAFPPASPTTPLTFVNWTENGVVATTSNPYVFPADQNRNLVANFTVNGVTNITGGSCVPTDTSWRPVSSVPVGTMVFWAIGINNVGSFPTGYSFGSASYTWSGDESLSGAGPFIVKNGYSTAGVKNASVTLTPVTSSVASVTVHCLPLIVGSSNVIGAATYNISTSVSPANSGIANGGGSNLASGTAVSLSAVANSGYTFQNWTDSVTGLVASTSNPYDFTASASRNLVANFTVSGQGNANGYTLTVDNSVNVTPGSPITLTWRAPSSRLADPSHTLDWVGLFNVSSSNMSFASYVSTNGNLTGTFNTTVPSTAGPFEFRYFTNGGYVSMASSSQITTTFCTSSTIWNGTTCVALPPHSTVTVTAAPYSVPLNGTALLKWSSTNTTTCTAHSYPVAGLWSGTKATSSPVGESVGPITGYERFTLACTGSNGTEQGDTAVTVSGAPVVTLTTSPSTVASGASATITWSSTGGATSCFASSTPNSNLWNGTKTASGSQPTGPLTGSQSYYLSCSGPNGSGYNQNGVSVIPAPIISLSTGQSPFGFSLSSTNQTTVVSGGTINLSWSASNATSCTGTGDWSMASVYPSYKSEYSGQPGKLSGSQKISNVTSNKHFLLSCTGIGGLATTSLDVALTVVATSTATSTGAGSHGKGHAGNGGGNQNQGGNGGDQNWGDSWLQGNQSGNNSRISSTTPTVHLSASPVSVFIGSSSILSWSSNAASCLASGGVAGDGWAGISFTSGSLSTGALTATTTYTMVCSGSTGMATSSSVRVGITVPPAINSRGNQYQQNMQYQQNVQGNNADAGGSSQTASVWDSIKSFFGF